MRQNPHIVGWLQGVVNLIPTAKSNATRLEARDLEAGGHSQCMHKLILVYTVEVI